MFASILRVYATTVRMNFSHGSYEYHQSVIDNTRKAVAENPDGRPVAIALDTVRCTSIRITANFRVELKLIVCLLLFIILDLGVWMYRRKDPRSALVS